MIKIGNIIEVISLTKQQQEDTTLSIGDKGVIIAIEDGGCSINFENDISGWKDDEHGVKYGHGWTLFCEQVKGISENS